MNLKSYSRGIGAGLIVAALVLGIGTKNYKMSDADIKKRASELGMTESSTLTGVNNNTSETSEKIVEDNEQNDVNSDGAEVKENMTDNTDEPEEAPFKEKDEVTVPPIISENENPDDMGDIAEENVTGTDSNSEDPDLIEEADEEKTPPAINPLPGDEKGYTNEGDAVEIVIIRGDSSVSVARRMYEAGLVESAVEFDKFLCANGYDKVISVGTYKIEFGLDFDDMAKIITRRN